MKEPSTFPAAVWNGMSDNPNRTSLNDDIPPDTRDWDRLVSEVIDTQNYISRQLGVNGIPLASGATGDPHSFYVLANSSGNTWYGLETAMQSVIADNTDMDNRYEAYKLVGAGAVHGTPMRLTLVEGVKATGQSDDAVLTANTVDETDIYNNSLMYVVESPTGNRTNPVSTWDSGNNAVYCTVPNTGNTTWNAIVTSWNAAQAVFVADLVAGSYQAGVTTTGNSTIQLGSGVVEEVRATTLNAASGNVNEATVFGLVWNGVSDVAPSPNELVLIQTGGTITFTANQTANVVEGSVLSGGAMVVGEAYYAGQLGDNGKMTNVPEAANKLCVPIGTPISPTKLRLRLGLPVTTTVGA